MLLELLPHWNYKNIINILIPYFAYSMVLTGVWLMFSESISSFFNRTLHSSRLRNYLRDGKKNSDNMIFPHIKSLLLVVYQAKKTAHLYTFFIISVSFLFLGILIFTKQRLSVASVAVSLVMGLLPYGYLQLKLRVIRIESSYEGEGLITELSNQYKINYFNMLEAIDRTIPKLKQYPYVRKQLLNLALAIKEYRTEEDLQQALNQFTYGINTSWSILLTNNIYFSIHDKMNVTVALEDMITELRHSKKILETSKRLNHEGFAIIKYIVPGFYIGSIYVSVKYFGFTLSKFFDYQLNNPLGFKLFVIIIIALAMNYAIMHLCKRQKFDF